VPVTHLANVVLLMVERLEKSEAPAPRGGRLDTVG